MKGFGSKPRIDMEIIQQHCEGIIALSACREGEIPRLIDSGKLKEADNAAQFYQNIFGEGNFYLEVQANGIPGQNVINDALYDMSHRLSIPLVATNNCHYLNQSDARAHEILRFWGHHTKLCSNAIDSYNGPHYNITHDKVF
jgi:DNA polymerase-3 subunit alpha